MRLIDADMLIETIKGTDTTYNPHFAILLNSLVNLVNEQPTAFDVDKVVEEIYEQSYFDYDEENHDTGYCIIDTDKAIDIVKRGAQMIDWSDADDDT